MGRKKKSEDRGHQPDARYNSVIVTKFICRMMWQGKKSTVTSIMYDALGQLQEKSGTPALEAFLKALENVKPVVEVKSRRVGGATYQVPIEIRDVRRDALAMRWIIAASRNRSGKSMADRLAAELTDAFNSTGTAVKKREDTHRMAEANKAFAHYRW
ncbi:MAG: 30S ribosomal protein S7 [Spirochaetes bacterium]|nr:30S ribosomal protein S7 [Spirochaetota bacterium]MBU1080460.1 30S ribosomal protein S7 [Spirochaetota bacterium]